MSLESSPESTAWRFRLQAVALSQEVLLLAVFIAMISVFSILNPRFLSSAAAANVLQDFSPVMLMAIGQTFVIITGGIDLSVGSILGLSGVVTALIVRAGHARGVSPGQIIAVGLLGGLAVGLAVGLLNGVLVAYGRLAPFIATLSTLGVAAGLTLVITGGVQIAGTPAVVIELGSTPYFEVLTVPVIAVLIITALAWLFLAKARFGRWTYGIGSNSFAARAAGIGIRRHLIKIYVLSGLLAACAGVFVYFRLGAGSPLSGRGGELNSIAAAVIGGISLRGGTGRLSGTILGSLITTTVLSGLIIIGIEPVWQQVVIGALIAAAVGIQGFGATRSAE